MSVVICLGIAFIMLVGATYIYITKQNTDEAQALKNSQFAVAKSNKNEIEFEEFKATLSRWQLAVADDVGSHHSDIKALTKRIEVLETELKVAHAMANRFPNKIHLTMGPLTAKIRPAKKELVRFETMDGVPSPVIDKKMANDLKSKMNGLSQ